MRLTVVRTVSIVQTMLAVHRRLPEAANPKTRDLLERQIADTDAPLPSGGELQRGDPTSAMSSR